MRRQHSGVATECRARRTTPSTPLIWDCLGTWQRSTRNAPRRVTAREAAAGAGNDRAGRGPGPRGRSGRFRKVVKADAPLGSETGVARATLEACRVRWYLLR